MLKRRRTKERVLGKMRHRKWWWKVSGVGGVGSGRLDAGGGLGRGGRRWINRRTLGP
jgi:hypothetical protein